MRKFALFTFLLLMTGGLVPVRYAWAQTSKTHKLCNSNPNAEKYWNYRFRLYGDGTSAYPGFVRPGTDLGESLPVDGFFPDVDCYRSWILNERDCEVADQAGPIGNVRISDACQDLGYYIAVLATEYEVLNRTDQNTDSVVHELWLALKAFDRLDEGAEQWYPGADPALDGFFLRDDVPGDFYRDPQSGILRFPHPDPIIPGYQCVSSAWSCGDNSVDDGTFCSQDQMIYMITGLALVDKFIPESLIYNGDTLVTMARHDVHRMVKHLRDHDWTIRAPDGTTPPAQYGGSAATFSYKFAELGDLLTQNRYFEPTYQNAFSEDEGSSLWFLAQEFVETQPVINQAMILTLTAITHNWDAEKQADVCIAADMELFALMQSVLYEEGLGDPRLPFIIEEFLDLAPWGGPCHDFPGCKNVEGWQTSNRWLHPDQRNGLPDQEPSSFNGLDFMLLYNLYEIYKMQQGIMPEPCPEPPVLPFDPNTEVFPNPFSEQITVRFHQEEIARGKVEIVDIMGRLVYEEVLGLEADQNVTLVLETAILEPGMFWVIVTRGKDKDRFRMVKYE